MSMTAVPVLTLTVIAGAALTNGRWVAAATGGVPAAAGRALGVARTDAALGEPLPVDVLGTASAEAGAAIAKGARVEVDALGRAVTLAAGVAVGVALEAAAGAGAKFECLLITN